MENKRERKTRMLQIGMKLNVSAPGIWSELRTRFSSLITFGQSKFNGHYADVVLGACKGMSVHLKSGFH